ncbi:MAG: hypothetical protein FWE74_09445 [Oscillospiraceae bacterium]|nr:hypothetical protein [Oscillospiraceae bacterium]
MENILEEIAVKCVNAAINKDLGKRAGEIYENLIKKLNDEETFLFIEYADALNEYVRLCSVENIKQGFRLAQELCD